MAVELAPELLEILACPNCHGALAVDHERDELVCLAADCGLAYPVRQQIPVLLIDEARRPDSRAGQPSRSSPPPLLADDDHVTSNATDRCRAV